jgi:hypothetical protein
MEKPPELSTTPAWPLERIKNKKRTFMENAGIQSLSGHILATSANPAASVLDLKFAGKLGRPQRELQIQ